MKRFLISVSLCVFLLVFSAFVLNYSSNAADDLAAMMLRLPAPPPPNPAYNLNRITRPDTFFDRNNPPPDDAPIEDLLDYWRVNSRRVRSPHDPPPSEHVVIRLAAEIEKDPRTLSDYLNVLHKSSAGVDLVKRIFDLSVSTDEASSLGLQVSSEELRGWLTANSRHFIDDLEQSARQNGDGSSGYVDNLEDFHNLTRVDWERAKPNVDRMYADSTQPASQALARWALYRQSITENSLDVDRFRDELKAAVEDKTLPDSVRDLSLDALLIEKEWGGRDDWYFKLMSDETLVLMERFTGLTTLVLQSPPGKYDVRMAEFTKSENRIVRTAAVRNLIISMHGSNPDTIRALLPWLGDKNWVELDPDAREPLVIKLSSVKLPESVPYLIDLLDERAAEPYTSRSAPNGRTAPYANTANALANAVVNAARTAANAARNAASNATDSSSGEDFPFRMISVSALAMQADPRAVPALRRILAQTRDEDLEEAVIGAILASKGYSHSDQADALERVLSKPVEQPEPRRLSDGRIAANATNVAAISRLPIADTRERRMQMLGSAILKSDSIDDELVRELVRRIELYERSNPTMADLIRRSLVNWGGEAINSVLLLDLKSGKSNLEAVVKLLANREELKKSHISEISDVVSGKSSSGRGVAACLLNETADFAPLLEGNDVEAKTTFLACARLIRLKIPVNLAAKFLDNQNKRLANAAEAFLESEDSAEARSFVLSKHPGEAKILGATTAFWPTNPVVSEFVEDLFASVQKNSRPDMPNVSVHQKLEAALRDEIKSEADLLGIYSYANNAIRIYRDRALFSWDENEFRYRQRVLRIEEFEEIVDFLKAKNAEEMPPFLNCFDTENECETDQILMLGKNGGRRIFSFTERKPYFFIELQNLFANYRRERAELKYNLEKEVAGLKIHFADDNLAAINLWKSGNDFRLFAQDIKKRDGMIEQVQKVHSEALDTGLPFSEREKKVANLVRSTVGWYDFDGEKVIGPAAQPRQVPLFGSDGNLSMLVGEGGWKSGAGPIEVRTSDDAIYVVSQGSFSKIKDGEYRNPVIDVAGKWVVVSKNVPDLGWVLYRINLQTKKEFRVTARNIHFRSAVTYLPVSGRFLVHSQHGTMPDVGWFEDLSENLKSLFWLNAETGAVTPASGEIRPLLHQVPRPLQQLTASGDEYWAAIPDLKNRTTDIGIYDARLLKFTKKLKLPNIIFASSEMWVDTISNRAYFVFEGHVLSVPLPGPTPIGRS